MKVALQAVGSALQIGHEQGLALNHGDITSIIDHLILNLTFSSSFKIASIQITETSPQSLITSYWTCPSAVASR
jgi:hypothetical protein